MAVDMKIQNQRFGRLIALYPTNKRNGNRWKNKKMPYIYMGKNIKSNPISNICCNDIHLLIKNMLSKESIF